MTLLEEKAQGWQQFLNLSGEILEGIQDREKIAGLPELCEKRQQILDRVIDIDKKLALSESAKTTTDIDLMVEKSKKLDKCLIPFAARFRDATRIQLRQLQSGRYVTTKYMSTSRF